ncbi:MAG: hypothetical protein E6772_16620 [Dysgonomonas sp.]|nr:hypothetical protein [Dysgonomonas sp.]
MSINKRFVQIVNTLYSGKKSSFANAIGVNPSVIENIVGRRQGNPSFEVTQKVLIANANINAEWLMTGRGSMVKDNSSYSSESIEKNDIISESDDFKSNDTLDIELSNLEDASKQELIEMIKNLIDVNTRNSISIEKMVSTADRNSITLSRLVDVLYNDGLKGRSVEISNSIS